MDDRKERKRGIVVPVLNTVLLPGVTTVIHLGEHDDLLLRSLESEEVAVALPFKQPSGGRALEEDDFYSIGVSFLTKRTESGERGDYLEVKTLARVDVTGIVKDEKHFSADYIEAPEGDDLDEKSREDMLGYFRQIVSEICENLQNGDDYRKIVDGIRDINTMITYLSQFMPLSAEERYELLKTDSEKERCLRFMDFLLKQKESIELSLEITEKFSQKANRVYREQVLREQLKAIQEELNEGAPEGNQKSDNYRDKIEAAALPPEIEEAALKEVQRLESLGQGSAEEGVIRNYLDFIIQMPWEKEEPTAIDLPKAREILNRQHYGLEKVKERILQHLAVMQLKKDKRGSILLLVGPPGTGKTSLGKSIAEALERPYVRLSLGGIRDEAEIRGHRRTYVGAMAGNILKSMKKAGTTHPVMVLDEVDKLMTGGFSGDPASALLEVLDPEQNNTFTDHYLDLPYDLSDVFFIATANSLETIPEPLLDRMETIEISGYTAEEKFHIAKEHLIPSVLEDHGLLPEQLIVGDAAVRDIIEDYTREAGVRGLKKQLEAIARAVSEKIVLKETELPYEVKGEDLEDLLGQPIARHDKVQQENPPGVVTGLAWTPAGGEILFIEATDMPGSGQVTLTGKLGDVMKESAMISLSLLKSRLPLNSINFKERDIHIHVPSGAVPKDGPSAGIALFTALASLFTGRTVDSQLAMTGEVTLRGAVLPIGGLKEKLLGAQRAGITKVLVPRDNAGDLKDLPPEIKEEMKVVLVDSIEDVLRQTIDLSLPPMEHVFINESMQGRDPFRVLP